MALRHRIRPLRARLLLLFAVLGPGIITANVDNDAGGITTYSVAGAHYGYSLMWIMPLLVLALIIVQEMSARLGVVTGKGLADLIRESLGVRLTALIIGIVVFANLANTVSEFAGVAASLEIFGVTKYISVPIAAVVVWLLIVKANYKFVERIFLVASLIFITYIISGVLAHPNWPEVGRSLVTPTIQLNAGYMTMVVTIIGTTIAPWMQFYQQASIVDKGPEDHGLRLRTAGCHRRLGLCRRGRVVHHDRLRGDAVSEQYPRGVRQRCGHGLAAVGRPLCFVAVCVWPAECFGVFGRRAAALDGLCGV